MKALLLCVLKRGPKAVTLRLAAGPPFRVSLDTGLPFCMRPPAGLPFCVSLLAGLHFSPTVLRAADGESKWRY